MAAPGRQNRLILGLWNFVCDTCGFKHKSDEARFTWDGFIVCPSCYEPKHPQIELTGFRDNQSIPWSRPDDPVRLDSDGNMDVSVPLTYFEDLVAQGKSTNTSASLLVDSNATFSTAGVQADDVVFRLPNPAVLDDTSWYKTTVVSVDSETQLTLADDIFTATGSEYIIRRSSARTTGDDL